MQEALKTKDNKASEIQKSYAPMIINPKRGRIVIAATILLPLRVILL